MSELDIDLKPAKLAEDFVEARKMELDQSKAIESDDSNSRSGHRTGNSEESASLSHLRSAANLSAAPLSSRKALESSSAVEVKEEPAP